MARDFQPSNKSLSPTEQASSRLRYICRAAEVIEKHLGEEGELPPWVLDRINQSAQLMGMAVSYVAFSQEKKFQRQEEAQKTPKSKTNKVRAKKPATAKRKKP